MIEWGTTACNPETDVGCVRSGSKSATFMKSEEGGVRHRDAMSDRIPQTYKLSDHGVRISCGPPLSTH
jgi:hypothetical protein